MSELKNIAIVFGGYSGERVVSEKSARVVLYHLPKDKYVGYLVDVDREKWEVVLDEHRIGIDRNDFSFHHDGKKHLFDGVFNAIHGTPGEDGIIQGYFDLLEIPYNNCGVLASSLSFNKAACNAFLKGFGVKVASSVLIQLGEAFDVSEVLDIVGLPCFVKPNDGGSSIGITKVKDRDGLIGAVKLAQSEGVGALVEAFMDGVEVSCGCISIDGVPKAVAVTEIVPANEFFDFDSKYTNEATQEITPARLSSETYNSIMRTTEHIYRVLHCKGMIRVDFMVCKDGVYLIEPNTTPGLSEASILPQQAKHAGYTLSEFFDLSFNEMFKSQAAMKRFREEM